jgi:hypothetical protein
MTRAVDGWLARLSDPAGLNLFWPARPLAVGDSAAVQALLHEAQRHNVHLALSANLLKLLQTEPGAFFAGTQAAVGQAAAALCDEVRNMRNAALASSMRVAAVARTLRPAIADLPAVIVKGIDFAENAYGGLHLRAFGDVDILLSPGAVPAVEAILVAHGFHAHRHDKHDADYTERQWIDGPPESPATVLVELHTDMVHTPELRRRCSLTHDMHAGAASGGVTPAARLVLAALHGATSHLFGRLQYIVDGMMIARSGVDAEELTRRAHVSGAMLPVGTMLRLAGEIHGCGASLALAERVALTGFARIERRLITAPMVLAAKAPNRWRLLAQRHAYRLLLRA